MKLTLWYDNQKTYVKTIIKAISAAAGFFISAIIPNELVNALQLLAFYQKAFVYLGVFAVMVVCYIVLYVAIKNARDKISADKNLENEIALLAYTKCDDVVTTEMLRYDDKISMKNLLVGTPLLNIQKIVTATYETMESFFGKSINPEERIKFEVTFMTRSYIDNEITIPAFKNKENRKPISLQLRKNNPKIYNNTITAFLYREERPSVRIIEDTSDPQSGYKELYSNQQDRIRSSIVFPVLSNENLLLGTLVVHGDKKGFFKKEKTKFWTEVLEIFAKRIAHEKLYLDHLAQKPNKIEIDLHNIAKSF